VNTDIRLSVEFWRHPKTKKLIRRTGLEGARSLQILWLWAVVNRPDGNLAGMDDEAIELAADWEGEEGRLASTLVDVAFLDGKAGERSLHGWLEYNAWQTGDGDRADTGRFNVLKSKMPSVHAKLSTAGITRLTKADYEELKVASRTQAVVDRLLKQASAGTDGTSKEPQSTPEATPEAGLESTSSILQVDLSNPLQSPCPSPSPSPYPSPRDSKANSASRSRESKPKAKPMLKGRSLELFDQFWDAFDFKQSRKQAEKAWADIPCMTEELAAKICEAARREAALRPQYTARGRTPKYPQGWLNDRRWEDDYDQREAMESQQAVPRQGSLFDSGQRQQGQPKSWDQIRYENNLQAARAAYEQIKAEEQSFNAQEEEYEAECWTAEVVGDE
jgi:hypothetical protein